MIKRKQPANDLFFILNKHKVHFYTLSFSLRAIIKNDIYPQNQQDKYFIEGGTFIYKLYSIKDCKRGKLAHHPIKS